MHAPCVADLSPLGQSRLFIAARAGQFAGDSKKRVRQESSILDRIEENQCLVEGASFRMRSGDNISGLGGFSLSFTELQQQSPGNAQ
jgi:hypothetical protein